MPEARLRCPWPPLRYVTTVIVVDAGVLVTALADDGPDGDLSRSRLGGQALAAPHLIDLEVGSALRRLVRAGDVPERRARLALTDLADLPLDRAPAVSLQARCWELPDNVTSTTPGTSPLPKPSTWPPGPAARSTS